MDKELKFMKTAALIFKVLSWFFVAFFIFVAIVTLLGFADNTPRIGSVVFIIGGAWFFLVFLQYQ
ncbi:MAG: hypothetical protein KJ915_00400 [Candidatus Omnitrophica bacterium]|nr:hypothetical protein [Candidatus Omnitrophota bacterium]